MELSEARVKLICKTIHQLSLIVCHIVPDSNCDFSYQLAQMEIIKVLIDRVNDIQRMILDQADDLHLLGF